MSNTSRWTAVVLGGLALVLTGCGSSSESSAGDSESSSSSASSSAASPTSPSTPSTPPSTTPSSPAGTGPCRTAGLKITLGPGEGAAGSTFFPLVIKNVSTKACRTGGFGGVSLVTSPRSEPVGAPADRTQKGSAKPIVLKPGQAATATLQITSAENFNKADCRPSPTQGLRVYPPNETHAAYVAHAATACESASIHLLTLRPYRAG